MAEELRAALFEPPRTGGTRRAGLAGNSLGRLRSQPNGCADVNHLRTIVMKLARGLPAQRFLGQPICPLVVALSRYEVGPFG
jgi:hypothetical protein